MTSQLKHCEDGQTLEDSKTYEESLETARRKRPRSATSESVRSINEVTLNDGLKTSDSTSVILAQGSGNKGGLLPFWNKFTQEESKKWWLPERFEFNYLFALIYCFFFILLTFLLGPIVLFLIRACGMDL